MTFCFFPCSCFSATSLSRCVLFTSIHRVVVPVESRVEIVDGQGITSSEAERLRSEWVIGEWRPEDVNERRGARASEAREELRCKTVREY